MDKTVTRLKIFNAKNHMNAIRAVEALTSEGYTAKIIPVKDGSIWDRIMHYEIWLELDEAIPFEVEDSDE